MLLNTMAADIARALARPATISIAEPKMKAFIAAPCSSRSNKLGHEDG
jgi:hypothetical protein